MSELKTDSWTRIRNMILENFNLDRYYTAGQIVHVLRRNLDLSDHSALLTLDIMDHRGFIKLEIDGPVCLGYRFTVKHSETF